MNLKSVYSWWLWFLAAIFYALDYFQHTAPSVLIAPIAQTAHITVYDVGSIMSIYFPVYALSQLPAGYLLDRFAPRFVLALASLVVSIGLYFMALPTEAFLIVGRLLIAVGSAFAYLGALKVASIALDQSFFALAVGLTNTIGVLGGILGLPFLNRLIAVNGWERAVTLIAIFGVCLAILLLVCLRLPRVNQQPTRSIVYQQIFKDRQVWFLALYAGIMVGTVVNAFSELYDVTFLQSSLHVTAQRAADISSMIFIGIAVGGPLHGVIARVFRHMRQWMMIGCLMTIMCFIVVILSSWIPFAFVFMYVLYFLIGFFVSTMLLSFAIAKEHFIEQQHGSIFALVNMVIGICGFVFQFLLSNLLSQRLGYTDSFLCLLVPLLISLGLCYYGTRERVSQV